MNWKDWYLGAAFVVFLWVLAMVAVVAGGLAAGVPMLIVSHVTLVLSTFFLMLALVFVAVGSGTVVAKDLMQKAGV